MTRVTLKAFCSSLPDATPMLQWGGSDVGKVGGKAYAIGAWDHGAPAFTFSMAKWHSFY